jgi:hypothetical protein
MRYFDRVLFETAKKPTSWRCFIFYHYKELKECMSEVELMIEKKGIGEKKVFTIFRLLNLLLLTSDIEYKFL